MDLTLPLLKYVPDISRIYSKKKSYGSKWAFILKTAFLCFTVLPPTPMSDNFPALRKEHWLLSQAILNSKSNYATLLSQVTYLSQLLNFSVFQRPMN